MIQTVLAWMRLLRLPNHATAVADVLAGFLIVSRTPFGEWPADSLWLVIGASLCFYGGGMILNDVFDYRLDCVERPERPLPSGLISVALAGSVATVLLAAGLLLSIVTAVFVQSPTPAIVGTSLLIAIVAYDFQLKQTSVGPIAMGICRSLNWLLGMSAVGSQERIEQWIAPLGMGIYVAGITWYSRREAGESRPKVLAGAAAVMFMGLVLAGSFPWISIQLGQAGWLVGDRQTSWYLLWSILVTAILARAVFGIADPTQARIRAAVSNAILSIITLDSVLVLAACGESCAIVVLLLLAPAFSLSRTLSMT